MFITVKRHEREKHAELKATMRLNDALLKHSEQGLLLLDAHDRVLPQYSKRLATLFRRQDFANLSFEKLLAPHVTAKTLTVVRNFVVRLVAPAPFDPAGEPNPLTSVDLRLTNPDGSSESVTYSFDFTPIEVSPEPRIYLVRVTDVTARLQAGRDIEDLRQQLQTQGEILRGVLHMGGRRFGSFMQRTDAAMKTIAAVLKKTAREEHTFRGKLEETIDEVDRVRREAAAFKLVGLGSAARTFVDALHDLRGRSTLSGSDFLPLAVKLDELYGQFALLKTHTAQAAPVREHDVQPDGLVTEQGTQIIQAPKFDQLRTVDEAAPLSQGAAVGMPVHAAPGTLEHTLNTLTEMMAEEHGKTVSFHCGGLGLVPPAYQSAVKNVAIQLIRNAVMHGIEAPAAREAAGKPLYGTLTLEFKQDGGRGFELMFEDDGCGIDPDLVRATAVARGVIDQEGAARLRDRQAIKLIFKSGYTTLADSPADSARGTGMSFVRRYVQESGGRIALASLPGHETRFRFTFPPVPDAESQVA